MFQAPVGFGGVGEQEAVCVCVSVCKSVLAGNAWVT